MTKGKKSEPEFFKWIRSARARIRRETKGMTPQQYADYMHARSEAYRRERMFEEFARMDKAEKEALEKKIATTKTKRRATSKS